MSALPAGYCLDDADPLRDLAAVRDIFTDAVLNTTALYEYVPWTDERTAAWFAAKAEGGFPVLAARDAGGTLRGFSSYGVFRARPAYKYTVESSVYIAPGSRGQGLGRALMEALVLRAVAADLHTLVACIDASNAASIALHGQLGFVPCGVVRQAGFKFGRWLDLAFHQRILATPAEPRDG